MNARALITIASGVAALGVLTPPPALASSGSYTVAACSTAPGFVNHAFSAVDNDPTHLAQGALCPALSGGSLLQQQEQGLYTADKLSATSGAITGASAGELFTAPRDTEITELSWDRYLGIHFEANWTVGLWVDGVIEPSDTCTADYGNGFECAVGDAYGNANSHQELRGLDAHELLVGVQCAGGGCTSGASIHRAWASIYDATVTLSDSTPPTIGPFSGSLTEGSESNTQSLNFAVSDSTGIKELDVALDGEPLLGSPGEQACDYTNPVPCPSLPTQTYTISTAPLAAGTHTVVVKAIDAAGLLSISSQDFTVVKPPSTTPPGTTTHPSPGTVAPPSGPSTGSDTSLGEGLRITRAQVIGRHLILTAELPPTYAGRMAVTVSARHGRRMLRYKRTVELVRGVAHVVLALDAIERSVGRLSLIVHYSGDSTHPAQTRSTTIRLPHPRARRRV
jgi:hypothetical protein